MIVTCPRCLTKFNLPEGKSVSGAELNLHCSRCGWDFFFSPQPSDLEGVQDISEMSLAPEVGELEKVAGEATDFEGLEDEVSLDEGNSDVVVPTEVKDEAASLEVSPADVEDADDFIEEVFDDSIFELADDFDDDEVSLNNDAPATSEETLEPTKKSEDGGDELKVEGLALDIDDLNLDDIEFDSFDDEPDSVSEIKEISEEIQNERPTQLDDGDLDNLINQVDEQPKTAAATIAKEGRTKELGKQIDVEPSVESSGASPVQGKSSKNTNKKRNFILVFSCFVALSLALWAGYGLWQRFSVDMVKHIKLIEVENRRLRLSSERTVIVMRGKVVNSSPKLVTDLKLTGVLLDEAGQVAAKVVTAGGVSFSEEELDRLDAGKLAMLENTSVTLAAHGGELPFMIAFYDYPEKVSECYVELTSFKVKKGRRP
ncbi:MAG: DUF3426 domain-containing protein [Pseudomonadota bacterium]|nr:DUF3426 domain-containing protein [Pseudomonadota bacterium]